MKTVKKLVLAAAVVPLAFASASAFAFGGKGEHRGGHCQGGMDRGVMKQLDLTDEQKTQFKDMREANHQEMKANYDERQAVRRAHHEKVQQLVLAENFDQAAANDLAKQMVDKQSERKVKMLEKQHKMLNILTPEQKTKFVELSQERMDKCAEKRKNRN